METTNNETLNEGAKVMEKLLSNTNSAMTDMYKKQMELTTSFYNNLFNSGLGHNNLWNQNTRIPNIFPSMDMSKWFANPLTNFSTGNIQNPFAISMENGMKQIVEFNQKMVSAFTNGIDNNKTNWDAIGKEYKETINSRLETSKEILNSVTETFNKQSESAIEMNIKTINEISDQLSKAMKQNQKLWSDMLKMSQGSLNVEEKTTESVSNENKKRSNVPVSEFMDHKAK